jgi:oxygen-dependent protoporphyrinogen oxidase
MERAPSADVLIIGAGLSGLTIGFRLAQAGLRARVIEAAAQPGGVIGSRRRDGVLCELGPNSALDTTPLIGELLAAAGIGGERCDASAISNRRYILRGGKLLPLPSSPLAFLSTPLFSAKTKLGLLREPFIGRAPAGSEESVADFVKRRLGQEFLDYAIEPFVAGIYAGDPDALSVRAAFPRLVALEDKYGSLIRGALLGARERKKNAEKAKDRAKSFSFRDGMQTLTDALARGIGADNVNCGASVTAIRREPGGYAVEIDAQDGGTTLRAPMLVLATPAYAAAPLIEPLAPATAQALAQIAYPPVASVVSAYRREAVAHPLDGFGFLAPRLEKPAILGALFSSSMFDLRAPDGVVVTTAFVGGRRAPQLAQRQAGEIEASVRDEMTLRLGAGAPLWSEVTRWEHAIPQYTMGHLARLATVDAAEQAHPGLFFCANYRGGVSVGDCIKSAHQIVARVLARRGA